MALCFECVTLGVKGASLKWQWVMLKCCDNELLFKEPPGLGTRESSDVTWRGLTPSLRPPNRCQTTKPNPVWHNFNSEGKSISDAEICENQLPSDIPCICSTPPTLEAVNWKKNWPQPNTFSLFHEASANVKCFAAMENSASMFNYIWCIENRIDLWMFDLMPFSDQWSCIERGVKNAWHVLFQNQTAQQKLNLIRICGP